MVWEQPITVTDLSQQMVRKWGESEAQCAREKFLDHWAEEYARGQKEVLQDRRGLSSCKQ